MTAPKERTKGSEKRGKLIKGEDQEEKIGASRLGLKHWKTSLENMICDYSRRGGGDGGEGEKNQEVRGRTISRKEPGAPAEHPWNQ